MPSQIILDSGQVLAALVTFVGVVFVLIGTIFATTRQRTSARESNAVAVINSAIAAQSARIDDAEREIERQSKEITALRTELASEKELRTKQGAEITRIKHVVKDWIKSIAAKWITFTDEPMPTISDEDLETLEITAETIPRRAPRSRG